MLLLGYYSSVAQFKMQRKSAKAYSLTDEDYQLWVLLQQARHTVFRVREKELRRYGITSMESAVLFILKAIDGEATPSEIARWLLRERHTVSSLLSRMEGEGLVSKTEHSLGKGMVRVSLTKKGEQAYEHCAKRDAIRQMMSALSEEERQLLRSCLEKLRDRALKQLATRVTVPFP